MIITKVLSGWVAKIGEWHVVARSRNIAMEEAFNLHVAGAYSRGDILVFKNKKRYSTV